MKFNKLFLIFILALILRLILLHFNPIIETDSPYYIRLGENLINNGSYLDLEGLPTPWFPPLYPILIGIFSFTNPALIAKLISVLFGSLVIFPVFFLTKKLFNKKIALISSFLVAIYPILTYISTLAYPDSLYIFLMTTFAYTFFIATKKNSKLYYLLSAILIALAYLARGEAVAFLIPSIVLILFKKKDRLIPILILLIIFFLIAFPYINYLHNHFDIWSLSGSTGYNLKTNRENIGTLEYEENNFKLVNGEVIDKINKQDKTGLVSHIINNPKTFFKKYFNNFGQEIIKFNSIFHFLLLILVIFSLISIKKEQLYLFIFILFPFLIYPVFFSDPRYLALTLPFLLILIPKGIHNFSRLFKKFKIKLKLIIYLILIIALLFGNILIVTSSTYSYKNEEFEERDIGVWLKQYDNITIMDRKALISYYANAKYILMPYADYDETLNYACKNDVNYIVINERYLNLRPQLKFLINETPKELNLVYTNKTYKYPIYIYQIKENVC